MHELFERGLQTGVFSLLFEELVDHLFEAIGFNLYNLFLNRTGKIFEGDFVTADSGSGLVHCAPGHGHDDYIVGMREGLPVLSPVDDRGCFTAEAGLPELEGVFVFKGNQIIIDLLKEKELLWSADDYQHSYPHCWRSKKPIIFRSVTQWFIKMDQFRQEALDGIEKVTWVPDWGKNRIRGAVETRPDWCISRQRTWGVPIPAFYDKEGNAHLSSEIIEKVADLVENHGTNYWFNTSDEELCQELGLPDGMSKGLDTLDVWIDSGSSHAAVMKKRLSYPADLYLEGSDQHRGWFQSSLLTAVALEQEPPYREVLTNGFVIDMDTRKKLSKSSGKPVALMAYVDKYGADILRLWVSSQDYRNDVPFSEEIFKRIADTYRQIRNILRILLANLYDYDHEKHAVSDENLDEIDRYILTKLQDVIAQSRTAYDAYEFHQVYHTINRFCAVDLSAFYVDVLKDRMYCDHAESPRRRSSQTAMHEIFTALCKLIAPITPFTAEEAWQYAVPFDHEDQKKTQLHRPSIHLETFPQPRTISTPENFETRWTEIQELRTKVNEQLEPLRKDKIIGKSLEACIQVKSSLLTREDSELLSEICMVSHSEIKTESGASPEVLSVEKSSNEKCTRCWRHLPDLGSDTSHPELCPRCTDAVTA